MTPVKPPIVEPIDLFQRGIFDRLERPPWSLPVDNFGLEEAAARLGQGVVVAVAAAPNGRPHKTLNWKTPAESLDEILQKADDRAVATTD